MKNKSTELPAISIIIPAYNEEGGIEPSLNDICKIMSETELTYEIIVVNDGSTDRTVEIASKVKGVDIIDLPENRGYGAALKTGIRAAKYDVVVITDADGTYPADRIPDLVESLGRFDMVVGARIGENVSIPNIRKPAKWALRVLSAYLAGRKIPDLNSGLRVIKKDLVQRFEHLLPSGFSFTTTITLASLCTDCLVKYVPIDYHSRIGDSKIKATHAFDFLFLIIRTIVYFNPLKIFIPLGSVFFLLGISKFAYDLHIGNFSETALLGFVTSVILWCFGLLSDQIAKIALRPKDY